MTSTARRVRAIAVAVVVALAATACGGDDDSAEPSATEAPPAATEAPPAATDPAETTPATEPTDTEPVATEPTATEPAGPATTAAEASPTTAPAAGPASGDPFVIGASSVDSGIGNLKPLLDGFEAFVAYANAEDGGFGGHPGEVRRCDYENDPQRATDCARGIAEDTEVSAAVGIGRHADVLVTTLESAADPVAFVSPGINRPVEGTASNVFALYAGSPMGFYSALTYFAEQGYENGYFTTADSDAGHATGAFLKVFAESMGMTVSDAYFSTSQSDFLPVAQAALAESPDFILIGAGVPQELAILQAFQTLGSTTPVGTWSSLVPQSSLDLLAGAGFPIVMDALVPDASTSDDPEVALYREWMETAGFGDELGDLSLQGWLAGRVIQSAANQAGGDFSRANILEILRTGTIEVPILGDLSLTNAPTETEGYSTVANPTVNIAVFENGEKTILDQTATLP